MEKKKRPRIKRPSLNKDLPGYPPYPTNEDIYSRDKEETEIDPEQTSKKKIFDPHEGKLNEKDFREDLVGDDLDVPGADLDDKQENVGSEDEENNLYSLGGDKD